MKKILALFSLFGLCIGLGLLSSNDSYAVSDYTIVQTSFSNVNICDNNSSSIPHCSDYTYLSVENTGAPFSRADTGPVINTGLYGGLGAFKHMYLDITGLSSVSVTSFQGSAGVVGDLNITYTLTSSLGIIPTGSISISSNGSYDVTSYATAVVDIPDSDVPPFIQIIIDAFWEYHTYFAGAVVAIIVIFLVYRLLKGRMR